MGLLPAPTRLLPRPRGWGRPAVVSTPGAERPKLQQLFGDRLWPRIRGQTVIDFGSGFGKEAVELLQHGAARVIGVDIRPECLAAAQQHAAGAGFGSRCQFVTQTGERAAIVLSIDSFEHFADPGAMLGMMAGMLNPGGELWISFGPTWFHPLGGHVFSFWPWSHLLFTERSLLRWRARYRDDGARRFGEVGGGLNQMTIARFLRLVRASPLEPMEFRCVPIRRTRLLHGRITREFLTSCVQARLRLPEGAG